MRNGIKQLIVLFLAVMVWYLSIFFFWPQKSILYPHVLIYTTVQHIAPFAVHFLSTGKGAFAGVLISSLISLVLVLFLYRNRWLSGLFLPFLIAVKATPIIAIVPLLIKIFGTDAGFKMATSTLAAFLPVILILNDSFESIEEEYNSLLELWNASGWQRFIYLELPWSITTLFAALKTASVYAVAGAVAGEIMLLNLSRGQDVHGLGIMIVKTAKSDSDLLIPTVLMVTLLSLVFYWFFAIVARFLLPMGLRQREEE